MMALVTITAWGAACSNAPIVPPAPEQTPATVAATRATTALPLSFAADADQVATPMAIPTAAPPTIATPRPTSEPATSEEDCMAGCHIPDPNETFGAGAKPLPANHAERTTCLQCHTTASAPVLPASHLGRLDPACRECHK